MSKTTMFKDLIGKEVQIYPGDSRSKFGILQAVDGGGAMFKITRSDDPEQWPVGKLRFVAFSANLSFLEV